MQLVTASPSLRPVKEKGYGADLCQRLAFTGFAGCGKDEAGGTDAKASERLAGAGGRNEGGGAAAASGSTGSFCGCGVVSEVGRDRPVERPDPTQNHSKEQAEEQ